MHRQLPHLATRGPLLAGTLLVLGAPRSGFLHGSALAILLFSLLYLLFTPKRVSAEAILPRSWTLFLVGVTLFGALILGALRYYSFSVFTFDTGIYAQQIVSFWEGRGYQSSVLQRHALGEHFTPMLLLLSPLVGMVDSALPMILLKALAVGLTPLLLWLYASKMLDGRARLSAGWPAVIPIMWVLSRPTGVLLETEFQPTTVIAPVIVYLFLRAKEIPSLLTISAMLIVLGAKENCGLVIVALGAYLILMHGRYKHGGALILIGMLGAAIIYFLFMPYFASGVPATHAHRLSPFSLIPEKLSFLFRALWGALLLPLCAPRTLLFILPAAGTSLLVNDPLMVKLGHHYHDILMPILFIGATHGLCTVRKLLSTHRVVQYGAALAVLACGIEGARSPWRHVWQQEQFSPHAARAVQRWGASVPPHDCVLWAQDALGVHLFRHPQLRSISNPSFEIGRGARVVVVWDEGISPWPLSPTESAALLMRLDESPHLFSERIPNSSVRTWHSQACGKMEEEARAISLQFRYRSAHGG